MEENALLSNISTILAKDLLVDNSENLLKPKNHFLYSHEETGAPLRHQMHHRLSTMDDSDEDEVTEFFLKKLERKVNKYKKSQELEKKAKDGQVQQSNHRKRPNVDKSIKGETKKIRLKPIELNLLNKFDSVQFEGHLHLAKMTFLKLFQTLRSLLISQTPAIGVAPHSVFSLSLWKLTTDEHFEEITRKFGVELYDCQRIIRHFWNLVGTNYKTFVHWPKFAKAQQANISGFQKNIKFNMLKNLFGIVILKRLDIFIENEEEEISVIFQIVCDSDQKVIDCFAELAKDYNFDESPIAKALSGQSSSLMPENSYLIGDTYLPLKSFLICPFIRPTTEDQQCFNKQLKRVLTFGQQVLDTIAKRFNILYALEARDLPEVRKILLTVCALHNLCVNTEDDYIDRKREVIKFNWATADGNQINCPRVNEELGEKIRADLMNDIVKQTKDN